MELPKQFLSVGYTMTVYRVLFEKLSFKRLDLAQNKNNQFVKDNW